MIAREYRTQVQTHTSLETHGGICEWNGDNLTAWVSTQAGHGTREGFAQGLKIPQANIRVVTEFMGGGFGSKFGPDIQGLLCARLAKRLVKCSASNSTSLPRARSGGMWICTTLSR